MTNNDLIAKLKDLKNVNPDAKFLADNRDLLLTQISNSGAENISAWKSFIITFENVAKISSRPAFAIGAFFLVLLSAGLFSEGMLKNSKPNDSLYIARVISERLRINTTFNLETREKLESNYALSHAEDVAVILSDENFNNEANSDQVAKLNDNFKEEIDRVKTSLSRRAPLEAKISASSSIASSENTDAVVIAENSKDKTGLEIYIPNNSNGEEVKVIASTTATSTVLVVEADPTTKIEELNTLFAQKDYVKAQEKLNEIKEIIE